MVHLQAVQEIKEPTLMGEEIKQAFLKVFPNSHFSFVADTKDTSYHISLVFEIALGKDKSEWGNGYINNDPMGTKFIISGFNKDDSKSDKIEVKNLTNYGLYVKPSPNSHMALDKIKVWTGKFTAPSDKVIPRLTKYFVKLKEAVKENLDRLPEHSKTKV